MNRVFALGIAAAGALVALSQVLRPDPWSAAMLWAPLLAAASAALLVRGLRLPQAPPTRATVGAGTRRTILALAGATLVYLLLPRWGLVASYRADAARSELIATTFVILFALVLILLATEESSAKARA